jgi:hypothetical protein
MLNRIFNFFVSIYNYLTKKEYEKILSVDDMSDCFEVDTIVLQ